jgi:hypothetical protein
MIKIWYYTWYALLLLMLFSYYFRKFVLMHYGHKFYIYDISFRDWRLMKGVIKEKRNTKLCKWLILLNYSPFVFQLLFIVCLHYHPIIA